MIIQIRGTSGSGKSTAMRRVMTELGTPQPVHVPGRRQPLYYRFPGGEVVLGHYASNCGGCDTIGSARAVYELVTALHGDGQVGPILSEGLLLSEDVRWSSQMSDLRIIFLTTPTDQCLEWVQKRRASVGNDKPLNPSNTVNRIATIERARLRLTEAGVYCRRASVEQTPRLILNWLHAAREKSNGSGTIMDQCSDGR